MFSNIRRDPAMRYVGRATAGALVAGFLILNAAAFQRARAAEAGVDWLAGYNHAMMLGVWIPVLVVLTVAAFDRRVRRFDMATPAEAGSLWLAHTAGLVLAALAALASTVGAAWIVERSVDALIGRSGPRLGVEINVLAYRLACVAALVVVLLQSVDPAVSRLSLRARHVVPTALVLAFGLAVVPALDRAHPAAALVLPTVAAALAVGIRRRFRGPFRLSPSHASLRGGAPPQAVAPGSVAGRPADRGSIRKEAPSPFLVGAMVVRIITKMPLMPLIGVPLTLGFGFALSGWIRAWGGGGGARFMLVPLTAYMLLAFVGYPPRRLYLLDGLPVSRRSVFAAVILVPALILAAGYAGGRIAADRRLDGRELVEFVEIEGRHYTRVPIEYCEIAWDGDAPRPSSPWGESAEPWTKEILRGRPHLVYSPFSVDGGSSIDFVALQISRAVEAVYDARVEPEAIRERYLEVAEDGSVRPKENALTIRRDLGLRVRPLGPVFPFMALVAGALWLLTATPYFSHLRADVPERSRKSAFWLGMLGLLGVHLVQTGFLMMSRTSSWVVSGVWEIAIARVSAAIPAGRIVVWVVAALVLAFLYRFAERRFLLIESSPGDDRFGGLLGGSV